MFDTVVEKIVLCSITSRIDITQVKCDMFLIIIMQQIDMYIYIYMYICNCICTPVRRYVRRDKNVIHMFDISTECTCEIIMTMVLGSLYISMYTCIYISRYYGAHTILYPPPRF